MNFTDVYWLKGPFLQLHCIRGERKWVSYLIHHIWTGLFCIHENMTLQNADLQILHPLCKLPHESKLLVWREFMYLFFHGNEIGVRRARNVFWIHQVPVRYFCIVLILKTDLQTRLKEHLLFEAIFYFFILSFCEESLFSCFLLSPHILANIYIYVHIYLL